MLRKVKSCYQLKIGRNIVFWLTLTFLMVAIAIGSVGEDRPAAEKRVKAGSDVSDANVGQITIADDMIQSVSFKKDIDLRDAVRFLAAKYQKNIVISSKVEGLSSVTTLYNVSFREALEAILGKNFEYEEKGNVIEVFTRKDETRMKYRVFVLRYISSAEAKTLVTPILSENGKVEVTSAAVTGVPTGASISSDTAGGDTMAVQDTVVIYDYAENIAKAEDVISAIDTRPKQVLIESTILSAKLTEDMQAGIDWQTLHGTLSAVSGTRGVSDYFSSAGTAQVTKTGGMKVGFTHDNIAGFIKAVEEITDTTVLANPKILAVNKQLGQVYIGTKLGYREGDVITDGGATQEGSVKYLDTGTKLSFRPYIGDDGYIRMDIHSKDSSGSLNAQNVPDEISAEVVSNIIVKDGETIVIGGLFRDETVTKRTQIPVFGDIPIIGMLFRGTADKVERHEVMVLLTPHIIEQPGDTEGSLRAEDVNIRTTGVKDKLQAANRNRLALDSYSKAARFYIEGNYAKALKELDEALRVHPADLESLRLKEKILSETDPAKFSSLRRMVLSEVEKDFSGKWKRK